MAQVCQIICISSGEQSTDKCNKECIDIRGGCKHTQDNNGLLKETNSTTVCKLKSSDRKMKSDVRHDCNNGEYGITVPPDVKPLLSGNNEKPSTILTTVALAGRLFKMDGTMELSVLDQQHESESEELKTDIQHGSDSEEFKPDTTDEQEESFGVTDLSSDCGDDDDDFSYLSDVNESEMPDSDLTSVIDDSPSAKPIPPRNQLVKCPQCDKCVKKRDLDDHVNVKHTKKHKYLCELCGEGFLTPSRMKRHKVAKHRVGCKYIKCEECPYRTPYYSTFKRHVLSHQRKSSGHDKTMCHECKECGKFLATADSLRVHLKAHKNGKPFTCIKCAKCFAQKGNLKTHLVQHIKEERKKRETEESKTRSYICDQCDKVFRWRGDLCRHKKVVHLGIKKFVCGECGKKFASKNHLEEHTLWHQNLTPYPCSVCHKSYRSKYRLKYHFMKCHEESMYALNGILTDTHTSNLNNSNTSTSPSDS